MKKDSHIDEFEYTFEAARGVALSATERAEMKENILSFMAEHPVQEPFLQRLWARVKETPVGLTRAPIERLHLRPALAALLIVCFVGTGTSYAAEGALPGDLLYPIKTAVNENIASALSFSEEARANASAAFAVRRLEEAGALAAEGRLTPALRIAIEARFEKHAQKFEFRTAALAEDGEKVEIAADAQSSLEASLKAHASALADLANTKPDADELRLVVAMVNLRADVVARARAATERIVAVKVGREIQERAADKKRAVESELAKTRGARPAAATVARQAETEEADSALMMMSMEASEMPAAPPALADPVLDALNAGSVKFDEGRYGEAFTTFQEVLRAVQQEKIEISVRERLNLTEKPYGNAIEEKDAKEEPASVPNEVNPQRPSPAEQDASTPQADTPVRIGL